MDTIDAIAGLVSTTGLPWLDEVARRMEALGARQPTGEDLARAMHAISAVGLHTLALAQALQARADDLDARGVSLATREEALRQLADEARAAGEELRQLVAIADSRCDALRTIIDRR